MATPPPSPSERATLFEALFEASPDGIITVDSRGIIQLANARAEALFGYARSELVGSPVEILVPDELRAAHQGKRAAYSEGPRPRPMGSGLKLLGRRKSGEPFPVEITLSPVPHLGPGAAIAIVRDVTERRRVEEEVERAHAQIRDLYDFAPCGYHSLDPAGTFCHVNETELGWLGRTRGEVLGRPFSDFLAPESKARFEREFASFKDSGHVDGIEFELLRKGGARLPVLASATAIRDERGELVMTRATMFDITDRKRMEEALRRTSDELAHANRELEMFSYSVAHDLRAPLRTIDGFSTIVLEDLGASADHETVTNLERIRSSAKRMGELIDALLALGRTSRAELRIEPVDLSLLGREVGGLLAERHPERQVELEVQPDMRVQGDARLLRALLENLLGNAWKFTAKVPAPKVELGRDTRAGEPRPSRSVYFVRDNGAGFDMAHASKLFGPFQRLHRASEFEGTGIGLATADRIVRRHGGRIWAEARPGSGATFYFTLPTID